MITFPLRNCDKPNCEDASRTDQLQGVFGVGLVVSVMGELVLEKLLNVLISRKFSGNKNCGLVNVTSRVRESMYVCMYVCMYRRFERIFPSLL
jgi:hypothetical protein